MATLRRSRPVRARGLKHHGPSGVPRAAGVAPRAGAWIETSGWSRQPGQRPSRPVRARGLKLKVTIVQFCKAQSRPVRARGLKLIAGVQRGFERRVAPRAGAWIETI